MEIRKSAFARAFPLGRLFGVAVRVHWLSLLVACVLLLKLGLAFGGTVVGILFVSVLLHEMGHVFAARATGGEVDEIWLWPIGGLLHPRTAGTTIALISTAIAGIGMNLLLCIATLPVMKSGEFAKASSALMALPIDSLGTDWLASVWLLVYSINFKLIILNLIPTLPQDCGQLVRALLLRRTDEETANAITFVVGTFAAVITIISGWVLPDVADPLVITVGFTLLTHTMSLVHRWDTSLIQGESDDEGDKFLGYDFSEGYTSLERPGDNQEDENSPGILERWKQKREDERRQKDDAERLEAETRLDSLLDKINRDGLTSLTDEERRFLERTSARYRSQG